MSPTLFFREGLKTILNPESLSREQIMTDVEWAGWWLLAGYKRVLGRLLFLCISFVFLYLCSSLHFLRYNWEAITSKGFLGKLQSVVCISVCFNLLFLCYLLRKSLDKQMMKSRLVAGYKRVLRQLVILCISFCILANNGAEAGGWI